MSVLENAIKHYQSLDKIEIEVKEWGTKIYATKMTVGETASVQKRATKNGLVDETLMAIYLIIIKSEDETGEKMFDMTQDTINKLLNQTDRDIVLRLAVALVDSPEMPELKKK